MTEDQLQKSVASYLALALPKPPRCLFWHTPNGGRRNQREAAKFKAMGVKPGVPDVLILHGGKLHGIELKVPGKYPTPVQRAFLSSIEENGGNTATCRSLDEVIGTVKAWGLA